MDTLYSIQGKVDVRMFEEKKEIVVRAAPGWERRNVCEIRAWKKRKELRTRAQQVCMVALCGVQASHTRVKDPRREHLEGETAKGESEWLQRTYL